MKKYPRVGSLVIIKDGGEKVQVQALWKPGRVLLSDGRIFYLRGIRACTTLEEIANGTL